MSLRRDDHGCDDHGCDNHGLTSYRFETSIGFPAKYFGPAFNPNVICTSMTRPHGQSADCVDVHLFTENRLLRESLVRPLQRCADIRVVAVSNCLSSAAGEIAASRCQVLLTDCLSCGGGDVLRGVYGQDPPVSVVLFGMEESLDTFLRAVYLGVSGYVLKDASVAEIVAAIRAVAKGEAVCPPRLCLGLIQHLAQRSRAWPQTSTQDEFHQLGLTHRQLELMSLVSKGFTNKEIAASLNLSEFTVKNHMRRILRQVDAEDRHEAVEALRASGVRYRS